MNEREARRDRGLALQDQVAGEIRGIASGLDEAAWQGPTNCPPWTVQMLIGHVARAGETFLTMVNRGLQGDTEIVQMSPEARAQREQEMASLQPADIIAMLDTNQAALSARLAGLNGDELERLCPHTRGLQPAWWFVDQRLAELAFHGWDLSVSLNREREIDTTVAQYLLPTLLERNIRTWYPNGSGGTGRWIIAASDVEGGRWLVEPTDGDLAIARSQTDGDVAIQGDAPALIRWLYGRADLEQLNRTGRVIIGGQRDRVVAWRQMFPSP